ncbi:MAG: hypothetical protein OIF57_00860 [Marinobacterium sp.]|nr:hypothetical protein [Marinobacterium sp.]
MNDSAVIEALKDQSKETRERLDRLSGAMAEMAKAVSALTTTITRVEERHVAQDELVHRIGSESNDHEQRLRVVEKTIDPARVKENQTAITRLTERVIVLERAKDQAAGGWKTIAVIASVAGATLSVGAVLYVGLQ